MQHRIGWLRSDRRWPAHSTNPPEVDEVPKIPIVTELPYSVEAPRSATFATYSRRFMPDAAELPRSSA